jgi:hypothetical protein
MEAGDDYDSEYTMTMMRDTNQSRAYAAHKAIQVIDKLVTETSATEKRRRRCGRGYGARWPVIRRPSQASNGNKQIERS